MADISENLIAIGQLLRSARVIAVVGHSDKPDRDSYQVAQYLRRNGYTVYPVNPSVALIDGEKSYASLADVPVPIDIVDVFRAAQYLPDIVQDSVAVGAGAVWGQFEVTHPDAAALAETARLTLVMDRCIKVDHAQLVR